MSINILSFLMKDVYTYMICKYMWNNPVNVESVDYTTSLL